MTAIKSLNTKLRTQYVLHVNFDVWLNPVLTPMCRQDLPASKSDMVINKRANHRCKLALEPSDRTKGANVIEKLSKDKDRGE